MYLGRTPSGIHRGCFRTRHSPTFPVTWGLHWYRCVKSRVEEYDPSAADAIEVVKGRVVLVDSTLTPSW